MGAYQDVRRLFNAFVNSGNITYITLPALAAYIVLVNAAAAWAYGVWTQIAASVGGADVHLVGIDITDPSAAVAYQIGIGTGAGAAEVERANFPLDAILIGAGGGADSIYKPALYPIRIVAGTRVAGRVADGAGASTVSVKLHLAVGV